MTQLLGWLAPLICVGFGVAWWRGRTQLVKVRTALRAKSSDLENLQLAFSRFAPEEIVERVITSGLSAEGERKHATVLFADLVGFTAISERTEPDVLVRILNGYFERMSRVITEHRGHISTLIGDGILALFGALEPNPWQGNDAVHAALAMRAELEEYNRELEAEGLPTLSVGIGLHCGSGVSGLVGSRELMQFTFVGRIVNLAARVQDLTRQFEVDILLTRSVQESIDARFVLHEFPPTPVRGIEEPVPIFAVEGFSVER